MAKDSSSEIISHFKNNGTGIGNSTTLIDNHLITQNRILLILPLTSTQNTQTACRLSVIAMLGKHQMVD